ncbi:rod shape-determining protein RodA [Candidatus Microgenomates bacterium]|nr:rod shape-determining protein RodA [Candidatus Microgenomates bacterium]
MGKIFKNFNWLIFLPILFLAGLSLILILSTASQLFSSQLLFFVVGVGLFFLLSTLDFEGFLKFFAIPLYILSVLFLGLSFLGPEIRGSHRWIIFFGFRIQPSELVKPLFIASFAQIIAIFPPRKPRAFFLNLFLMLIPFILIFKQPDLGSAILYSGTWLVMMLAAGLNPVYIFSSLVFGFLTTPVFWRFLKDYQKLRILSFLNPQQYSQTASYHSIQTKIAVGSGRFLGKGLGHGTQSHLNFLPEFHTDFIFASLCEELGLFGGALVLICYFILLLQILRVAKNNKDLFPVLFSIGVFTQLLLQIFINIGMNLGIVPITGITLPLLSYGGSSIISTLIALGVISSLKKRKRFKMLVIN